MSPLSPVAARAQTQSRQARPLAAEPRRRTAPHLQLVEPVPELPPVLAGRDPAFIRRVYPLMAWLTDTYYRCEIEGLEHLSSSASLHVATHNGSFFFPDAICEWTAYFRRFGLETPLYGLAHKAATTLPGLRSVLIRAGAVPASHDNARTVLRSGFPLFICPGGDEDNLKPFSQRHRVVFGGRRGFVRLALREQVPIIPMVSVGAHETLVVLHNGHSMARRLMLDRLLRIKTAPLTLGFPNGLSIAGLGSLPLPSKIRVRVLPPIHLQEGPAAAEQPEKVERCLMHVKTRMQEALTDLASKRRWPVIG